MARRRRDETVGKVPAEAAAAPATGAEAEAVRVARDDLRKALERGDVRAARALAREWLSREEGGPGAEEARAVLARSRPDPAALLAGALVALTILVAAWLALLHGPR